MREKEDHIRSLFSRDHETVFPRLGVFLAGPTNSSGDMLQGWRRVIVDKLKSDKRLNSSMIVVSPEPENGNWDSIDLPLPKNKLEEVRSKQIPWEWQYLKLCDIHAFWMPTYWSTGNSNCFSPNIGPTARLEFGYFLQEYLKNKDTRNFIIGSPEDSESMNWIKQMTEIHNIKWHILKKEDKSKLVADSFIEEIASVLVQNRWKYD